MKTVAWLLILCIGSYAATWAQAQLETAPSIVENPTKLSLIEQSGFTLSVIASGIPAPTLQWYKDGESIAGATGNELHVPSARLADSGRYYVVATNNKGSATSAHARVTVRSYHADKSVARQWNEEILAAIRVDYPAPTVHSRNLFHTSVAMYDAWCAYHKESSVPFLAQEDLGSSANPGADCNEAISHAAFTLLSSRYRLSPNAEATRQSLRRRMASLGYDPDNRSVHGDAPSAVGNRIGLKVLALTLYDGSNEHENYADQTGYLPINEPMVFKLPGVGELADPNQWQPLAFDLLVLQNGIPVGAAVQKFLGPNWGGVTPFALAKDPQSGLWADPGPPPKLRLPEAPSATDAAFKESVIEVIRYSSWLDPSDVTTIDVSPGARHNNPLGTNDGNGYDTNPFTGLPYAPNWVSRADYGRVLAEFWADGPDSETPPGHWNSVANHVSEHPDFVRAFEGREALDELEWDVKLYFALNGALYDSAIACWGAKRHYNYSRPITMIRYLASNGQSSEPDQISYDPSGIPLLEGLVEVITESSSSHGERHEHLSDFVGQIALRAWRGVPETPAVSASGVGWIRAAEWMPFQRDTFVTPPFGAYTSGHSTFSRAAAEVLASITGSIFFPGGLSTFSAKKDAFLEFELGPTEDITLTWATYYDAADEAGLSRLYGGIHVRADDFGGRIMGSAIGKSAFAKAKRYFSREAETRPLQSPFEAWLFALSLKHPNTAEPADRIPGSHHSNQERYLAGLDPLETRPSIAPFQNVSASNLANRLVFEMESFFDPEPKFTLQRSIDLKNWQEIGLEELITQAEQLGRGRIRYTLSQAMQDAKEPRFYYRAILK